MNHTTPEEMVSFFGKVAEYPHDSAFWQESWTSPVKSRKGSYSLDNSFSYEDPSDHVIEANKSMLDNYISSLMYCQQNPFITKYNIISITPKETILEIEMNILGVNKVAVCLKQTVINVSNNKSFHIFFSITDNRSKVIPFRDNQYLCLCYIFERMTTQYVKITAVSKVMPIPWCHPTDVKQGLRRQATNDIRIFKTLTELPTLINVEVPEYVILERKGFEAMIQKRTVGSVLIQTEDYTITEISRLKDEINLFCSGMFRKRVAMHLNTDTLIECVFKNSFRLVEYSDKDIGFFVLKNPNSQHGNITDKINVSAFYYSDECVLYHLKSTAHFLDNNEEFNYSFFNNAYVMILKDIDGYWNVQFEIDFTEKTSGLSLNTMKRFLTSIKESLGSSNAEMTHRLPTLQFSVREKSKPIGHSFFVTMQRSSLIQICLMLSKKDVRNLRTTCKQMYSLLSNMTTSEDDMEAQDKRTKTDESLEKRSRNDEESIEEFYDTTRTSTTSNGHEISRNFIPNYGNFPTQSKTLQIEELKEDLTYDFSVASTFQTEIEEENDKKDMITINAHNNVVHSVGLNTEGDFFVSGSSDRKVKVFDLNANPITGRGLLGPNGSVIFTAFVENTICVAYKRGTVKYFIEDNKEPVIFDSIAGRIDGFFPMKNYEFMTWSDNVQIVKYQNFRQNIICSYEEHSKKVTAACPFNEFTYLSGSSDRTLHLWDIRDKKRIAELKPHKSGVVGINKLNQIYFSSFGSEKVLCVWDSRMLKLPVISLENGVEALSTDQDHFVAACSDSVVKVYSMKTYKEVCQLACNVPESSFTAVDMKNKVVVCGTKIGVVAVGKVCY
ncbi:hypothetical protein EIN_093660 [Entamoeba invadens IP1]|uniref:Uncharacterized protein n=1 Tax=Entamoeba invadens IP1 TaxID=370355 RepID=A0A0A1U005_ENTIV|nr:hypothetical protein EIN_093660 [Entamoeba invadens IP1]ELP87209.1 hypothetical protein EIN_093660 [Entamoeba invadens IP1]|eukprot:XP_004253980.1 hypothetical protein EIN_093660 [Entamoeba invadens IP1]